MAWANIPPRGAMHDAEVRRLNRIREQTTLDPVERWRLREQRIQEELKSASYGLIRQADENAKLYNQITKEYK